MNYRDYRKFNSNNFQYELHVKIVIDDNAFYNYGRFQAILCDVLNKHAPIKKKILRANHSPFMTKQLRKMIMNRSRQKNAFLKNKTVDNWNKYRKLRNECVKLTKTVKKEYFENLDTNVVKNTKTFWKSVKPHFTNKGSDSKKIILVEKDEIITDNAKIADIINDYFINITKELNIPPPIPNIKEQRVDTGIDPIDLIIHVYREHPSIIKIRHKVDHTSKFSFIKIEQEQLEKEILVLNIKKAAGYDHISPKILKEAVNTVKAPLSNIFNTNLENCVFPSELKYSNVTPVFKKDDNINKENYRPISILPVISKIFERLMFQQMSSFVDNVISPYLCGFRKGYSTQHALLLLMNKINKSLDLKQKVGLMMMDLSKA